MKTGKEYVREGAKKRREEGKTVKVFGRKKVREVPEEQIGKMETESGTSGTEDELGCRIQNYPAVRRRLRFFLVCIVILMTGLAGKLAVVQLVDRERYEAVAARQQQIRLEGIDKRGVIYDRNGKPLTDAGEEYIYLLRKDRIDGGAEKLLSAAGARKLPGQSKRYEMYGASSYHRDETESLRREYQAFVIRTPQRYSDQQTAVHVIGYVNGLDGEGVSGLEETFDDWLSQRNKVVYAVADSASYIIPGFGIQNSTGRDCGLVTMLDEEIQKKAERILAEREMNGAIVVADVKTGEVLACASSPVFNPNQVKNYLNSDKKELLNLASQGLFPPGSIFKIVVAAAALEQGAADENTVFFCSGYEEIGGVRIKCSTGGKAGHGRITLRDAFKKSCNCAFIQLGEKVGAEAVLDEAAVLGLDKKTLTGISGEKTGKLPKLSEVQGAGIGNLSIGQGELLVTPLAICRMTQIIANGGKSADFKLVRGTMENGVLTAFSGKDEQELLKSENAEILRSFMVDTVVSGTANNISEISAGGKTGSAESFADGGEVVHGWFTGFLPAENPRYAVTVFSECGGSGRTSAVPLFGEMARFLLGEE